MIVNSFGSSNINKKSADIKYISLIKDLQFKVSKNGDIMGGNLNMNGNKVINIADPSFNSDVVNKKYVDEAISIIRNVLSNVVSNVENKVSKDGDLDMHRNRITHLDDPIEPLHATNKKYVDEAITRANN
jgi:hypothetical protein